MELSPDNVVELSLDLEQYLASFGSLEPDQAFSVPSYNQHTEHLDSHDAFYPDCSPHQAYSSREDTNSDTPQPEIWYNGYQINFASAWSDMEGPPLDDRVNPCGGTFRKSSHGSDKGQTSAFYSSQQAALASPKDALGAGSGLPDTLTTPSVNPHPYDGTQTDPIAAGACLYDADDNSSKDFGSGCRASVASEVSDEEFRRVVEDLYIQQGYTLSHVMETLRVRNLHIPS